MAKLFGITKINDFPCICYGKNAYFFKISWNKDNKKVNFKSGNFKVNNIMYNINTKNDLKFFGIMKFENWMDFVKYLPII